MPMKRMVCSTDWDLTNLHDVTRRERLMKPLTPDNLIEALLAIAQQSANRDRVRICWQESIEAQGYFRLWAQIPIGESMFDQLFNGRSGYRAQYYLSQE